MEAYKSSTQSDNWKKIEWAEWVEIVWRFMEFFFTFQNFLKFIYSEKATKFCEISAVDLSYVVTVKSTVEISQSFVAFSEYIHEL